LFPRLDRCRPIAHAKSDVGALSPLGRTFERETVLATVTTEAGEQLFAFHRSYYTHIHSLPHAKSDT